MKIDKHYLGVDYGAKRVGLAIANGETRLARPLVTLETAKGDIIDQLKHVARQEAIDELVMGLPRGLDGQETAQTARVRQVAKAVEAALSLPLHLQDEALTSSVARERLAARGQTTERGAIDREAAAIILQDFLETL